MKELLNDARHEIMNLRRRNEVLEAQVGVLEVFAAVVGLRKNSNGAAVDVVWQLQRAIDTMNKGEA